MQSPSEAWCIPVRIIDRAKKEGGEHMGVYERRLMILEMLSVTKRITYHHLAQELGVSVETIRMDVLALMCIYPIEVVRGCNGGVKLAEGYPSRRKALSENQSALLVQLRTQLTGEDPQMLDNIILQFTAR